MKTNPAAVQDICARTKNVKVVAATKYIEADQLASLVQNGITIFGENRVQAFLEKYQQYQGPGHWHFIGSLQTNKVKDIIDKVELIHSVDTYRLIDEIEKQSSKRNLQTNILLEVNIAKEESKHGFEKEEIPEVLEYLKKCTHINVQGFMMMAPFIEPEETRPFFQEMHQLLLSMQKQFPQYELHELSMGMSNDYVIAIEEGATIVRIGRALFCE